MGRVVKSVGSSREFAAIRSACSGPHSISVYGAGIFMDTVRSSQRQPQPSSLPNEPLTKVATESSAIDAALAYLHSADLGPYNQRIEERLRKGFYHGAVLVCRQALSEFLHNPGPNAHDRCIQARNMELMIEEVARSR